MFTSGWIHFIISETFLIASIILLQMSTKAPPSSYIGLAMWLCSVVAIWMLGRAMSHFDLAGLFALWLGVAILVVSIISLLLFQQEVNFWRSLSIAATSLGVVGLLITSSAQ
ncbi:SMR family transporter [Vibrio sp. SCSIO 43137]|uniref:SMR family transporter n=1 Tax=Vibrio sp. SCSIO 43137 TaxID=3021011 RepID=UPI00230835DB|nr:SMR family transporter [Vibrio sp. SCSIO 43137]WCE32596.1 SMR family transporter [Vibrio sp. SCSIO 43137]